LSFLLDIELFLVLTSFRSRNEQNLNVYDTSSTMPYAVISQIRAVELLFVLSSCA